MREDDDNQEAERTNMISSKVARFYASLYMRKRSEDMNETIVGLVSAFGVVIIKGIIDYAIDRRKRKDQIEDAEEEEGNEILTAIRAIKADMEEIKNEVETVKEGVRKTIDEVKDEIVEESVIQSRVRILRFADEMICNKKHTKDHFDQTMLDITRYEKYCDTHPDFVNDMTASSVKVIRESFEKRMKNRDFAWGGNVNE